MDSLDLTWRKASRSSELGDNCIEVASLPEIIAIRDSKDPDGPKLMMSRNEFRDLTNSLRCR